MVQNVAGGQDGDSILSDSCVEVMRRTLMLWRCRPAGSVRPTQAFHGIGSARRTPKYPTSRRVLHLIHGAAFVLAALASNRGGSTRAQVNAPRDWFGARSQWRSGQRRILD
jgi:hypothetical protein